jgi:hypothetical protein
MEDGSTTGNLLTSLPVAISLSGVGTAVIATGSESFNKDSSAVQTGTAVEWTLTNINIETPKYIQPYIIKNSGNAEVGLKLPKIDIQNEVNLTTKTIKILYEGMEGEALSDINEIFNGNLVYTRAKAIQQFDDKLYLANLSVDPIFKYQPYANNIKLTPEMEEICNFDIIHPFDLISCEYSAPNLVNPLPLTYSSMQNNSYRHSDNYTHRRGYKRGEVYSFYIAFIKADGSMSPAYHIPGRNAVPSPSVFGLTEDPDAPKLKHYLQPSWVFPNSNGMNFWKNLDEFYPNTPDFNTIDITSGNVINKPSNATKHVRHHHFPSGNNVHMPGWYQGPSPWAVIQNFENTSGVSDLVALSTSQASQIYPYQSPFPGGASTHSSGFSYVPVAGGPYYVLSGGNITIKLAITYDTNIWHSFFGDYSIWQNPDNFIGGATPVSSVTINNYVNNYILLATNASWFQMGGGKIVTNTGNYLGLGSTSRYMELQFTFPNTDIVWTHFPNASSLPNGTNWVPTQTSSQVPASWSPGIITFGNNQEIIATHGWMTKFATCPTGNPYGPGAQYVPPYLLDPNGNTPTGWNWVSGVSSWCEPVGSGTFGLYPTLQDCLNANVSTPMWDCLNGTCVQSNTSVGTYSSLAACQAGCTVAIPGSLPDCCYPQAVNILGFTLEDLAVPAEIANTSQGFRIYRANREIQDRTRVDQGLKAKVAVEDIRLSDRKANVKVAFQVPFYGIDGINYVGEDTSTGVSVPVHWNIYRDAFGFYGFESMRTRKSLEEVTAIVKIYPFNEETTLSVRGSEVFVPGDNEMWFSLDLTAGNGLTLLTADSSGGSHGTTCYDPWAVGAYDAMNATGAGGTAVDNNFYWGGFTGGLYGPPGIDTSANADFPWAHTGTTISRIHSGNPALYTGRYHFLQSYGRAVKTGHSGYPLKTRLEYIQGNTIEHLRDFMNIEYAFNMGSCSYVLGFINDYSKFPSALTYWDPGDSTGGTLTNTNPVQSATNIGSMYHNYTSDRYSGGALTYWTNTGLYPPGYNTSSTMIPDPISGTLTDYLVNGYGELILDNAGNPQPNPDIAEELLVEAPAFHVIDLYAERRNVYNDFDTRDLVWTGYEVLGSEYNRFLPDMEQNTVAIHHPSDSSSYNEYDCYELDIYGNPVVAVNGVNSLVNQTLTLSSGVSSPVTGSVPWTLGPCTGTGYWLKYEIAVGGNNSTVVTTMTSPYTITGLLPNTEYTWSVTCFGGTFGTPPQNTFTTSAAIIDKCACEDLNRLSTTTYGWVKNTFPIPIYKTGNIFGGDIFIVRETVRITHDGYDLSQADRVFLWFRQPGNAVTSRFGIGGNIVNYVASMHVAVLSFIVESTENIALRHSTTQHTIYAPQSSVETLLWGLDGICIGLGASCFSSSAWVDENSGFLQTWDMNPCLPTDLTNHQTGTNANGEEGIRYNEIYHYVNLMGNPVPVSNSIKEILTYPVRVTRSITGGGVSDTYRNFPELDFIDVQTDKGSIWNLFVHTGILMIQSEDGLYKTKGKEQLNTEAGGDIFVGSGNIFENAPELIASAQLGVGGTTLRFSNYNTKWGYYYIDYNRRTVNHFGQTLTVISDQGLREWMQINMPIDLYAYGVPADDEYTNTLFGFALGLDARNNRLLITKNAYRVTDDFLALWNSNVSTEGTDIRWNSTKHCFEKFVINVWVPIVGFNNIYFTPDAWTLSYYPEEKLWGSFHSYFPNTYICHDSEIFAWNRRGLWKHNSTDFNLFGSYYDLQVVHPFEVMQSFNQEPLSTKTLYSLNVDTKSVNANGAVVHNIGFTHYFAHTDTQTTSMLPLTYNQTYRGVGGSWQINDFRDRSLYFPQVLQPGISTPVTSLIEPMFIGNSRTELNLLYIDLTKPWHQMRRLSDRYINIFLRDDNSIKNSLTLLDSSAMLKKYMR